MIDKKGVTIHFRCPACNSVSTYYRSKTGDRVCRNCGRTFGGNADHGQPEGHDPLKILEKKT